MDHEHFTQATYCMRRCMQFCRKWRMTEQDNRNEAIHGTQTPNLCKQTNLVHHVIMLLDACHVATINQ
jgi:hypothetical protein